MTARPTSVSGLPVEEVARRVKAELRDRMRRLRKAIGDEARAGKSAGIAARVQALSAWRDARTVMLFVPMRTEVDVTLLERAARETGKAVTAPRMTPDGRGLEVRVWVADVPPVDSGRMGVREPPASAPPADESSIDLVVVPALALDPSGGRLGYGAGLYDSLLPRLIRAHRVGVVFDFQLVSEVPLTAGDEPMHVVVTESRTLEVAAET